MSLIFMTNTTSASVLSNGIIPLTSIARRKGCALTSGTNSVQALKSGYYKVDGTITFTGQATGNVIITLQKNGMNVNGITSSASVSTATTEINTLSLSGIVRVFCNEGGAIFTLINSGVAITVTNVALSFVSVE